MIVIVDYGMGNLRSVEKAFQRLGAEVIISSDPSLIKEASKLILPGVGHFTKGISNLQERNLIVPIKDFARAGKPLLGICLGMQLLTDASEEGETSGLGLIGLNTKKFNSTTSVKIPHMGWNNLQISGSIPLFENITEKDYFYFAHSYHVENAMNSECVAQTEYGELFTSVISHGAILGVQFHPEKSHDTGLRLLQNFIRNY
jgi:imidazole glycerol-phosphate synthase subunit HisH